MKIGDLIKRALSVLLVLALVLNTSPLAFAAGAGNAPDSGLQALNIEKIDGVDIDLRLASDTVEPTGDQDEYAETDMVRVSIVLEQQPTLERYSTESVALNAEAMAYRHELERRQATITSVIEQRALKGGSLDVVWNLTLAANLISANVEYGSIDEIAAVDGVAQVVIEKQYEPMTTEQTQAQPFASNSSGMIGAGSAWAAGYTGAGSRVAIIDTGLDTDHQSFDNGAYLYALEQLAQAKGVDAAEYIESLDLLDQAEVDGVFRELNIYPYVEYAGGSSYVSEKVPFALNYVDRGYDATHDNDGQGAHGSHVAGIAAANRYIPNGEGGYDNALDTVYTQGVAPMPRSLL